MCSEPVYILYLRINNSFDFYCKSLDFILFCDSFVSDPQVEADIIGHVDIPAPTVIVTGKQIFFVTLFTQSQLIPVVLASHVLHPKAQSNGYY